MLKGLQDDEVEFSMAPLGWLGGYAGNTLLSGTTRVLCDTRSGLPPDVVDFSLKAIEEENVSLTFVPSFVPCLVNCTHIILNRCVSPLLKDSSFTSNAPSTTKVTALPAFRLQVPQISHSRFHITRHLRLVEDGVEMSLNAQV